LLGIGASLFILLRLLLGLFGPSDLRFTEWLPYTKERLIPVFEDISGLLRFRLPERHIHEGLAGIVESFGLAVFVCMSLTGAVLFIYLEPGYKARGVIHLIKELHEIGKIFIPVFLSIHAGAVILHALGGRHLWRKMFLLERRDNDKIER